MSAGSSLMALMRLEWQRARSTRRIGLALAIVALLLLSAGLAHYAAALSVDETTYRTALRWSAFRLAAFILPFHFAVGAFAEDVENRTISYLLVRPISRSRLFLGKFFITAGLSAAILTLFILLLHVVCFIPSPTLMFEELPFTLKACAIGVLLTTGYTAICLAASIVLPSSPGVLAALYLGGVEFAIAFSPGILRFLSTNFHALELMGYERGGLMPDSVPEAPIWASVVALFWPLLLGVGASLLALNRSELAGRKQA